MKSTSLVAQARETLLSYYRQWQSLTETEHDAIRSGNWTQVQMLQAGKQELQKFIRVAAATLRAEAEASGVNLSAIEKEFCKVVERLIELETRNHEEITARLQEAESDLALVEASRHQLRQVHRAYSPGHDAVWQSYS